MSGRMWKVLGFIILIIFPALPVALHAKGHAPKIDRPPNVVLIAIDTLRSDHLGCYGYSRPTSPNIDQFASEGVIFEQCYSIASWTLPSFMSMFTGLMPAVHRCTQDRDRLSSSIPTLPEQFKKRGYYCAAVICNPHLNGKYGFGRGFDLYDDDSVFLGAELGSLAINSNQDAGNVRDMVTGEILTQQAKLVMDQAKKLGKPFFLFFLYFDPHDSYIPPPPYNRRFDPDYRGRINGRDMSSMKDQLPEGRDLQHLVALYDGEIAYTDAQIGQLLKKLDEVSDPTNTLTILISDHGEAFAEHGTLLHGNSAYREEISVPMIWRWPGVLPKGHRVKAPVCNLDIVKTLKELMHFEDFDLLQGESLWPVLLGGKGPVGRQVFSQKAYQPPCHVALTQGNLRCHARFDIEFDASKAKFELYNISLDPWEHKHIIEVVPSRLAEMKRSIAQIWSECMDLRKYYAQKGPKVPVDMTDEERRRLESLGYVGGGAAPK